MSPGEARKKPFVDPTALRAKSNYVAFLVGQVNARPDNLDGWRRLEEQASDIATLARSQRAAPTTRLIVVRMAFVKKVLPYAFVAGCWAICYAAGAILFERWDAGAAMVGFWTLGVFILVSIDVARESGQ